MAQVKTSGQKGGCHRDDCTGFDGVKYRFLGTQWIRKSVVDDPIADDAPVLTPGTIIEEGVCPHEKSAFGDLLEPLEGEHDTAEEQRKEDMQLSDYTVSQLQAMCKYLDLSGYSEMNKSQLVDYVGRNAGPSFEPSDVLESDTDEEDQD